MTKKLSSLRCPINPGTQRGLICKQLPDPCIGPNDNDDGDDEERLDVKYSHKMIGVDALTERIIPLGKDGCDPEHSFTICIRGEHSRDIQLYLAHVLQEERNKAPQGYNTKFYDVSEEGKASLINMMQDWFSGSAHVMAMNDPKLCSFSSVSLCYYHVPTQCAATLNKTLVGCFGEKALIPEKIDISYWDTPPNLDESNKQWDVSYECINTQSVLNACGFEDEGEVLSLISCDYGHGTSLYGPDIAGAAHLPCCLGSGNTIE